MEILHLPDEIILNILHWIQDDQSARECFAKANKALFKNLCWKIVTIKMKLRDALGWSDERTSNILERSHNLDFYDKDPSIPLIVDIKRAYSITSERGELVSQLERVHKYIFCDGSRFRTELTDVLQVLSEKTRLKSLTVKEVVLMGGELEEISVIEGLVKIHNFSKLKIEGLHLQAYASLRTVVVEHCSNVEDVASLDGIYDLTLKGCDHIKDISCLNNNYRITIENCSRISDVSKSFKKSHFISLLSLQLEFLPSFPSVTSLSLRWIQLQYPITTLALPNYIQFLRLVKMNAIEGLGPNNLQKVVISHCKDFKSLDNMANIRTVELRDLNLTSLYGLGSGNRVVRLGLMESLEDINALTNCSTISITNCGKKLLETNTKLQHVKELTLSLKFRLERRFGETFLMSNLEAPNLEALALPESLFYEKDEEVSSFYDNFRRLAERYPKVKKFSIDLSDFLVPDDYMKEMFVIDCSRERYFVLFRK